MGGAGARAWIGALWGGAMPLPVAFWRHAVVYGFIVNLMATLAMLVLIAMNAPGWLALAVHLAPLPYNVLFVVGVWRSAARWPGPPPWPDAARVAVTAWFAACLAL
ncbi:MAG: hypothetical protein FJX36_02985 [Alphaproteobacteria bacterium]|nr:hypothetical protein [Alphaproteobacteria bacterium]